MLASEIELAALRKRFLATSEQIARDLSLMAGRIDEEPLEVRALQLAAAQEIAAAQERLRREAEQLEGPKEQHVAIMRAVLEAQQAAQLQLAVIIKRRRPSTLLRANLDERLENMARQLEASAAASRLADEDRVRLPTNFRGSDGQTPDVRPIAVESRSGNGDPRSDISAAKPSPSIPLTVIIKAGPSLALLLAVASAALVLFFLFVSLPGARPHREVTSDQAMHGRGATPMLRAEREGTGAAGNTEGLQIQTASLASPASTNASTPKPAITLSTMSIPTGIAPNEDVPMAGLPWGDPLAPRAPAQPGIAPDGRQPDVSATAAQPTEPSVTRVLARRSPTLSNDAERFVPVVFTHKDRGAALRALAELQRRFPNLMSHRQSELQLVNTVKNGSWYRLVVLPAGSHQEALGSCDRLQAAGYDQCWVKAY